MQSVNQSIPKTIWMFWHDWDAAPKVAARSVRSWTVRNPDWTLRQLSWATIGDWLDPETIRRITQLDICVQHQSDLIRLELLFRHGGVWADSTTFCAWPLNDWLPGCMAEGFFAFRRDAQATPKRPIANWFLAAIPAGSFVAQIRTAVWRYWNTRSRTDDYFWFHAIFAESVHPGTGLGERWERVPKVSCIHPFHFGPHDEALSNPPTDLHKQLLHDIPAPVYKLTHKLQEDCGPGSLMDVIATATSQPFVSIAGDKRGLSWRPATAQQPALKGDP